MISRTLTRLKATRRLTSPHPATWLALLVPVFAWAQLTYPGYFEFHSGFVPIFNLNDLLYHLGDPAWAPAIGQSHDVLRGEGALPYRVAAVACSLGASPVTAVKWVFAAGILAGALGMYGWARRRLGSWPALVAEAVYLFWPIALATVYVRGALAEAVLLGLIPWVLWAADAAVDPGRKRSGAALALALATTFWTQTGLALWLAALVLVYILVQAYVQDPAGRADARTRRERAPLVGLLGWAGGVLLAGMGLLPVMLEHGMGSSAPVVFTDHLVYPYQLLQTGWGTEPSIPGPYDSLTFDLGVVAFCLALLSVLPLGGSTSDSRGDALDSNLGSRTAIRRTQIIAAAAVLVTVLLSTILTAGLWGLLPGLARTLSYPWQLLLLAAPWLAWLAGMGARVLSGLFSRELGTASSSNRELKALSLSAALIALVLLGSYAYLNPPVIPSPAGEAPVAIFGENEIALLDATVMGAPGPGGRAVITARWQALRPLDSDYTIFVHAVTPDGTRWAQVDTMPQSGRLPTTQWRPGQVVTDSYVLTFSSDAPVARDYRYLLGLYLWQTGQRLSARTFEDPRQGDDKAVLVP
jgi:hypothetical protein